MNKGCLVIHGLSGMPANVEVVTELLRSKGYLVKAPLLAGHGDGLEILKKSTWPEWYATVRQAYEELRQETKQIYFVGLSMGALLGLKLAIDLDRGLKALALLAPPFEVRPLFRFLVIPGVRYTPLRFFIKSVAKNFEKSVLDPHGREQYRQNSLPRLPSKGVFQTQDLVRLIRKGLPQVHQPLLLILGHKDHLVDPCGLLEIQRKVSSKKIEMVLIEHSAHVLTCDYEREKIAQTVFSFFETVANAEQTR